MSERFKNYLLHEIENMEIKDIKILQDLINIEINNVIVEKESDISVDYEKLINSVMNDDYDKLSRPMDKILYKLLQACLKYFEEQKLFNNQTEMNYIMNETLKINRENADLDGYKNIILPNADKTKVRVGRDIKGYYKIQYSQKGDK